MPRGVHNSTRGRKRKTDEERVRDGQAPRGKHPLNVEVGRYVKKDGTVAVKAKGKVSSRLSLVVKTSKPVAEVPVAGKKKRTYAATTPGASAHLADQFPTHLSEAARPIWADYVSIMASGLRKSDMRALVSLCEDEVLLDACYVGVRYGADSIATVAQAVAEPLPNTPLVTYLTSKEGGKLVAVMGSLAGRVRSQRIDFGLNPSARIRAAGDDEGQEEKMDEIEKALLA